MAADVDFIVTDDRWNPDFDDALASHPKVKFVTPDFVRVCWNRKKCLNFREFGVKRR